MYKKSLTHYVSKFVVDVLFYLSIVCTLCVPLVAKDIFFWIGYNQLWYLPVFTGMIMLSGACCAYILFNLKSMYKSLMTGNPFIDKNVSHLRKIAVACALIALIYISKCFYMFTYATLIISMVFVVGCLFCLTLKDLFKQAINYKTENDLTI